MREEGGVSVQRAYKDRLFRRLFSIPSHALELFNAISGTSYEDESELRIVSLEDAIYLSYRNDVAILIDDELMLIEHQGTVNPNMPLRGLAYFDKEYQGLLAANGADNFSERPLRLPSPRYLVLYNGRQDAPERCELRLSDAFMRPSRTLECVVEVVNVNAGHNQALMEACPTLKGYAHLVASARANTEAGMAPGDAVDAAVENCIGRGMLAEYLRKHRAEVRGMLLTEYDQERHERDMRDYWSERGFARGRECALLEAANNLMRSMGIGAEQAVEALGIPEADWSRYVTMLQDGSGRGRR